jgi:hypothetical protein
MSAVPLLVTTRQKLRVVKTDFLPDRGWADFVESHPEGLIYQPPGMVVGPPERISPALPGHDVCGRRGKCTGCAPPFYTRGFPIRLVRNDGMPIVLASMDSDLRAASERPISNAFYPKTRNSWDSAAAFASANLLSGTRPSTTKPSLQCCLPILQPFSVLRDLSPLAAAARNMSLSD